MTLSDWDKTVRPHLHAIEAGALQAARHARALPVRPNFESFAENELREARVALQDALSRVIYAQQCYAQKPVEA